MITRTTRAALPADERKEIEALLAATRGPRSDYPHGRFESNADEASFVFYVLLAGSVLGLVAYLVVFDVSEGIEELSWVFKYGFHPQALLRATTGALLAIPVGAYSLWRILANYRANGWALTSFGFVHIVRSKVRIVRYADISKIEFRRFMAGSRATARRATSITLHTRDGSSLHSYAASLLQGLRERVPADTPVVEL